MTDAAEIAELQKAILRLHGAKSEHLESVPVCEIFRNETVWDGVVEVFALPDHAAGKAYAWSHEADSGGRRYVAVFASPTNRYATKGGSSVHRCGAPRKAAQCLGLDALSYPPRSARTHVLKYASVKLNRCILQRLAKRAGENSFSLAARGGTEGRSTLGRAN